MLYGLLLEGANAQEQKQEEALQAQSVEAEDEVWCLGMEAWVNCDSAQTRQDG